MRSGVARGQVSSPESRNYSQGGQAHERQHHDSRFMPFQGPIDSMISTVAQNIRPRLQIALFRAVYGAMSFALLRKSDTPYLNYGFVPLEGTTKLDLEPTDEAYRLSIQLYAHVAGARNLTGKDVLEVGCGRGGGASYIARYLHPGSLTGVDLSAAAIRFCRQMHKVDNLKFLRGEAQDLPLPEGSFDVVVNIESSHCYPSFDRFLDEVTRVLRPKGEFLFADLRARAEVPRLREQLIQRFTIIDEECITSNVVRALELDSDRRTMIIQQRAPRFLRRRLQ